MSKIIMMSEICNNQSLVLARAYFCSNLISNAKVFFGYCQRNQGTFNFDWLTKNYKVYTGVNRIKLNSATLQQ